MISCFLNVGLFFIVLGTFGAFEGYTLYAATGIAYGPGQYLLIISLLILAIGVAYYVQEFKRNKKRISASFAVDRAAAEINGQEETKALPQGVVRCFSYRFPVGKREIKVGPAILAFILFILYAILTQWIGYLVSTVLFVVSAMLLFGERVWWKLALFGLIGGGAFWAVFVKLAGIPL